MDPRFSTTVESLHPSFQRLLAMDPVKALDFPRHLPQAGIYLLSEGSQHLYVGRTNRVCKRLSNHCRPSATHKMAAFAFRLAREATGKLKATYKAEGSRAHLMTDPAFVSAFESAKARIRVMDVRFVAEDDPVNQTILEVYVAVVLQTRYNDFDTH
jgi:hypothetical protein